MIITNRIKEIRKERNIFQQDLAAALGIERGWFSKIENMKQNPSVELMIKISNFFKMPMGEIFYYNPVESDFKHRSDRS